MAPHQTAYQVLAASGVASGASLSCLRVYKNKIGFADTVVGRYPLKDGSSVSSGAQIPENDGYVATGKIDVKYNFKNSGLWEYTDDNVKDLTWEVASSTINHPMLLFGQYYENLLESGLNVWLAPVFWAKFSRDEEIVRDYVPALDLTGRPCMFDKLNKKPYYNAGEGEFIAGVEKQKQLYSLLANLPDLTRRTQGTLKIRLDAALQTDELRAMIDERGEAKNWEITEAA